MVHPHALDQGRIGRPMPCRSPTRPSLSSSSATGRSAFAELPSDDPRSEWSRRLICPAPVPQALVSAEVAKRGDVSYIGRHSGYR